jgi:hypothetical protein
LERAIHNRDPSAIDDGFKEVLSLPKKVLRRMRGGKISRTAEELRRQIMKKDRQKKQGQDDDENIDAKRREWKPNQENDNDEDDRMQKKIIRAMNQYKKGNVSRASNTLLSTKLVPWTQDSIGAAKSRFPKSHVVPLPKPPENPPVVIDKRAFKAHVCHRVKNGGCPSASQWTGETLSSLVKDDGILKSCVVICEAIANNRLPEASSAMNLQRKMLAFDRGVGKSDRLVGVSEIFLRATASYIMDLARPTLRAILEPEGQFGCGAKGGSELALHVVQSHVETSGHNSAVLILDESDAFLTADRHTMLEECYKHESLAVMHGLVDFAYGTKGATMVMMRDGTSVDSVLCGEGTVIGCNLGSALYCLGAQPTINEINQGLDVKQVSVCDDSTTICEAWGDAVIILKRALKHEKKNVNVSKTKILWPRNGPPPAELVKECESLNIELKLGSAEILGGIIGCADDDVRLHANTVVESYRPLLECLKHPTMSSQIATGILRMCANVRFTYILRTHRPELTKDAAIKFDEEIEQTFKTIHRLNHSDLHDDSDETADKLKQLERDLPLSKGGLGLRQTVRYSHAAYFAASVASAQKDPDLYQIESEAETDLAELPPYLLSLYNCWKELSARGIRRTDHIPFDSDDIPSNEPLLPDHPSNLTAFYELALGHKNYKLQRNLSKGLMSGRYKWLMDHADVKVVRRWKAKAGSSSWLTTLPESPATTMRNAEWRHAVLFYMGIAPDSRLKKCSCGKYDFRTDTTDPHFDDTHFQSCTKMKRKAITTRHDMISTTITNICRHYGVTAITEVTSMSDGFVRLRPDGAQWFPDQLTLTDTTIRHVNTPTNVTNKITNCNILKHATTQKHKKYDELAKNEDATFFALAMLSYGSMSKEFSNFIRFMASAFIDTTPPGTVSMTKKELIKQITTEITVSLMKGHAMIRTQGILQSMAKQHLDKKKGSHKTSSKNKHNSLNSNKNQDNNSSINSTHSSDQNHNDNSDRVRSKCA